MEDASTPEHETLWSLIKNIKFGMLTHRHSDGSLQGHPLTTQNQSMDEDSTLYFFISQKSGLPDRLREDPNVNLAYADLDTNRYVSIAGVAVLCDDPAEKQRLWSSLAKAWFPGGVSDPDLVLLQVKISHAEYWNVKNSRVSRLLKVAKAIVTGETPKNIGEHKEFHMS